MKSSFSALDLTRKFICEHVSEGDICIDATAGRGNDTALLCSLVGESGKVIAFDIQPEAIESTRLLLTEKELLSRAELHLQSHCDMGDFAKEGSVSCIVFNFGWLPGGDHRIFTKAEMSIAAINAGLELLNDDGVMSLCLYYGGENGFSERDALLDYFEQLDSGKYTALVCNFANRRGCPPIPVFIYKGK